MNFPEKPAVGLKKKIVRSEFGPFDFRTWQNEATEDESLKEGLVVSKGLGTGSSYHLFSIMPREAWNESLISRILKALQKVCGKIEF